MRAATGPGYLIAHNKAPSYWDIIQNAGLTSGVKMCIDPGSLDSWNPAVDATKLKDLSGNGHHWVNRTSPYGTTSIAGYMKGTAGNLSESEYLGLGSNPGLGPVETDNLALYADGFGLANATFTIAGMVYIQAGMTVGVEIFHTLTKVLSADWNKGFSFFREKISGSSFASGGPGNRALGIFANSDWRVFSGRRNTSLVVVDDKWTFVAVSMKSNGNMAWQANASTETTTGAWGGGNSNHLTSPNTFPEYGIGTNLQSDTANGATPQQSGTRTGPLAVWNVGLDSADLTALYNALHQYRYPSAT